MTSEELKKRTKAFALRCVKPVAPWITGQRSRVEALGLATFSVEVATVADFGAFLAVVPAELRNVVVPVDDEAASPGSVGFEDFMLDVVAGSGE